MLTSTEVNAHFESVNVLTSVEVRRPCQKVSGHAPQTPMIGKNYDLSDAMIKSGQVCCFLDNDETGRKAVEEIGRLCEKVTDKAVHYLPHKDLNEFLQERIKSSQADRMKLGQACG